MAKQKPIASRPSKDVPLKFEPQPGVRLVRTLRRHSSYIGRIAWSPNGRVLASPSEDKTIRLWNAATGELIQIFKGHRLGVCSVAFDPTGQILASGSLDGTVILWNASNGEILHTLEAHPEGFLSVAFDPHGLRLASGGKSVKLWEANSGELLHTFEDSSGHIFSIAFDPKGVTLASASESNLNLWNVSNGKHLRTINSEGTSYSLAFDPARDILAGGSAFSVVLSEATSGKRIRTLEGHTSAVDHLQFLPNGQLLASKSNDGTVRIWSCDTWETIAILPARKNRENWWPSLAFHPRLPLLATVGSDPNTPEESLDQLIHIWELDLATLLSQATAPSVTYTSAKVVLVGESNVGKSYLAHRIATGRRPRKGTIKSTHGMKFWTLAPERLSAESTPPEDQRRDVVLWDMGGQEEYRLIHQLFLHDTTVALVLLDPTRGATAFKEVETWNKYLNKQLSHRAAVKLLVGAKLDQPSDTVDRQGLERLLTECGFADYYETSALTGRGLVELCEAVAKAIDWDRLGLTSRPELFQRIRDEIEHRRKRREVVLHVADLHRALSDQPPTEDEEKAVAAVTEQLATQGVIARSSVSTGEAVLVLQVQEIERYAGSLIIAARKNPRGVPALELRGIAQPDFPLPGIAAKERLPRNQERPVLECTVQLMLEHGICFQHEGLLIFPSLFAPTSEATSATLSHAVSLYYDFAGAIDNIYASLVAWLVLARDFGRVRLWSHRAEFEIKDGGLCGLRRVGRPGGFAHVDVYFDAETTEHRRKEFISFVEDHLARHGVEIREHVAITCNCGHQFAEETLRQRIARGEKDVGCPVCERRHSLTGGVADAREQDAKVIQRTWALILLCQTVWLVCRS